jgi:hypothetical protein
LTATQFGGYKATCKSDGFGHVSSYWGKTMYIYIYHVDIYYVYIYIYTMYVCMYVCIYIYISNYI